MNQLCCWGLSLLPWFYISDYSQQNELLLTLLISEVPGAHIQAYLINLFPSSLATNSGRKSASLIKVYGLSCYHWLTFAWVWYGRVTSRMNGVSWKI